MNYLATREMREVQIFIRGAWKETKGYVLEKDLCKYPPCNKLIPSGRSNYQKKRHVPRGYCSEECWEDHKNKKHLQQPLNEFFQEEK